MEAGKELDALVAEEVMRLRVCRDYGFRGNHVVVNDLGLVIAEIARYSTDIAAAWQVVAHLRSDGWCMGLTELQDGQWNCRFCPEDTSKYVYAVAPTAPLAVCWTALEVVEPS